MRTVPLTNNQKITSITMEIQGKIIAVLPLQQGTSKAGNPWKKQEYVLETHDQYPRKVKFDFFGDRADQYPLQKDEEVTVSFDLESREFNGRWYTDVRAWKAEKGVAATPEQFGQPQQTATAQAPQQPAATQFGQASASPFTASEPNDDLPF